MQEIMSSVFKPVYSCKKGYMYPKMPNISQNITMCSKSTVLDLDLRLI